MTRLKKASPYISGIAFASIFGFSFLIVKSTLSEVHVFQLLGLRFLLAAIVFGLLRLTKIIRFKLSLRDIKTILPVAIFQPIMYFIFEVYGIKNVDSSEAGLMIGMIPVTVTILSWIFLKEKMNKKQVVFMMMSMAGVVLISMMQMNGAPGSSKPLGYIFLTAAIIAGSFYNILSRKRSRKYSPLEITYVMMITGAIVFNTIGLSDSLINGYSYFSPLTDLSSIGAIIYLGILSSIVAFFFLNFTLSKIPAVQSSLFANLITVISVIAGVIFLNELFTLYKIIGSILIISGVFGINYYSSKIKTKD